ncbi:MAG: OsmC family protein [Candidatus Promineifilaceae bacterium]
MSTVTGRLAYKYQVFMSNGRHSIIADEPIGHSTDLGPGPYELLCASLAACKAMTVRMYAERKGWPLEGMDIVVSHEKVKASRCDECESTKGFVDIFECDMTFHGGLDSDQRERLKEISTRCPVHRSLLSETIIHSNLVQQSA